MWPPRPTQRGAPCCATAKRCVCEISFPPQPRFYGLRTADGIPYWKIAQLHSRDTLATTVLQTCIRYGNAATKCQFCAIGESLKAGRTIARKTPEQLAEVALQRWRLDGIRNVVMTTGTPPRKIAAQPSSPKRAPQSRQATGLPIQAQCEPPADFAWFERMRDAGIDALGMHLEAWDESVRRKIMPGKAEVLTSHFISRRFAQRSLSSAAARSALICSRGWAIPWTACWTPPAQLDRPRRLSFHRSIRPGGRHAAGAACSSGSRLHARSSSARRRMAYRGWNDLRDGEGRLRQMRRMLDPLHI